MASSQSYSLFIQTMHWHALLNDSVRMMNTITPWEQIFLPFHVEYADEVNFSLTKPVPNVADFIREVKKNFNVFNLLLNEEKTKITNVWIKNNLACTQRLGSILDDPADLKRINQRIRILLRMYNFIWKNRFINAFQKIEIYNTFVEPILTYDCPKWHSNKRYKSTLDISHREHLSLTLDIHYHKKKTAKKIV